MKLFRIFLAVFLGALSILASRLGVTVTIFAFVYLSKISISSEKHNYASWEAVLLYWLPILSIFIGLLVHLLRKMLQNKSQAADKVALPFVDHLTLRFLNNGNLYRIVLRGQSVHMMKLLQHLLVVFISTAAIFMVVPEIGVLAAMLLLVSGVTAFYYRRSKVLPHEVGALAANVGERTDHILMSLMVLGCIVILPRDLWLHAAVGLFVLARFLSSYRMLVTSVLHIRAARNTPPLPPLPPRPQPALKPAAKPAPAQVPKPASALPPPTSAAPASSD